MAVYKGKQCYTRVYKGIQGYAKVYKGIKGFTLYTKAGLLKRVNRGKQGFTRFTRIYKSLKGYEGVKRGIQGSERALFSYRSSTQDVQGWTFQYGARDRESRMLNTLFKCAYALYLSNNILIFCFIF